MKLTKYDLEGLPPLYYREGTSDAAILMANLGDKSEYQFPELPEESHPRVIFDIGANIGVISAVMANLYPKAQIYAYEPVPSNYEILCKNVSEYLNVHPFNVALGRQNCERQIFESDEPLNNGGFSFHELGSNTLKGEKVEMRDIATEIDRIGGKVDLIKIDTEGSEYEILSAISKPQLERVTYILGELHGTNDFSVLDLLAPLFHLGFNKALRSRVFQFYGQRKKR